MTAVAQSDAARRVAVVSPRDQFYARMAYTCAAVGILGFVPTYWLPFVSGALDVPPILHLHALVFYGWLALLVVQSRLAATRQLTRHREFGVLGVALATAMVFVGTAAAVNSIRQAEEAGFATQALAFSVVPLTGIALFAAMFAVALLYVKRPDIHKRLILITTIGLLNAAVGRVFAMALGAPPPSVGVEPPPIFVTVPAGLITDLLLVPAMLHDRKTLGRVHATYWIGGAILVLSQLLRAPIGATSAWQSTASFITTLLP